MDFGVGSGAISVVGSIRDSEILGLFSCSRLQCPSHTSRRPVRMRKPKKKQGDQLFDNTCHPRDSAIVAVFGAARSGTLLMPGLRPRRASTRPLWDYSPFLEPGDVSMAHFMPSVPHTLSFLYLNLHLKHQILEQKWRLTGLF